MPAPPRKPRARPGQRATKDNAKNRWPQREVRLAALWTTHPPQRTAELATDPALGIRTRLDFEPHAYSEVHAVSLGLLNTSYLPQSLEFACVSVKRGRWGAKPAELLMPLDELPAEMLAWPAVRLRGALRSRSTALEAVAPSGLKAEDEGAAAALWLASELALRGIVGQDEFAALAANRGWRKPKPGPEVLSRGGHWVWRGYARELARKLEQELRLPRRANPYRAELSRTQAARLLRRAPDELIAAALEELAAANQLRLIHAAYPETYALAGKLAAGPLTQGHQQSGETLLKPFKEGGHSLRSLQIDSAQLGVLNQLFEAERIVDLHQGFVVEIALLRKWLAKLKPDIANPPSVREIKDRLGLGRREAEALRCWLVAQGQKP